MTVFLTTHYMEEAAECDRVVVMDSGRVLLDDTPRQVFSHVAQLKDVGLDVPQVTELVYLLNQAGCQLDPHIIHEEECVEALAQLLGAPDAPGA